MRWFSGGGCVGAGIDAYKRLNFRRLCAYALVFGGMEVRGAGMRVCVYRRTRMQML